jgi:hypothetical protein
MRVEITIKPRDPHRDSVRGDAEFWLFHHTRAGWRLREDEDWDGRTVLRFDFDDPLDAMDFHYRMAPTEHRGRLI